MNDESKQIFYEFFNRFKDYIEDSEVPIDLSQKERDEHIISCGSSLDIELKDYYGMSEKKIKEIWGVTFKERAIGFIEARKTKTQDEWLKRKIKKKTLAKKESLMISERAINYLFGRFKINGVENYFIKGKITPEMMDVYDYLSRKLSNVWGPKKNGDIKDIVLFNSPENFFNFLSNAELEKKPFIWELELTLSKVRNEMGYTSKEMSIEKLYKLFDRWSEIFFGMESSPILYDAEKKTWYKVTLKSPLFHFIPIKLGIISNRWKTKDYKLKLRFSTEYPLGWLVIGNISCGKSGLVTLPERAFIGKDKLDDYGKNILREIRLGIQPLNRLISEWAKIAGYKKEHITDLTKAVINKFKELKSKKYIKDFKVSDDIGSKKRIRPIRFLELEK